MAMSVCRGRGGPPSPYSGVFSEPVLDTGPSPATGPPGPRAVWEHRPPYARALLPPKAPPMTKFCFLSWEASGTSPEAVEIGRFP